MGNKKKTGRVKAWKLAGDPIYPSELSPKEEHLFSDIFLWNEMFSMGDSPLFEVSASLMKTRESAARASLECFCRQFGKKYHREDIVAALATAVSLPTTLTAGMPDVLSFLLGAALWFLDYMTVRELDDKLEELLPFQPDDEVIFRTPSVEVFTHSWTDILRLISVLSGRKGKHRKAFRSIMALVDKETAAHLRSSFRDVLFDYFDRLLEVSTRVKLPAAPAKTAPPFVLATGPSLDDILESDEPPFSPAENSPDVLFLMQTMVLIGAPMPQLQEELRSRRSAELLAGFTVRDPYEICAAYLLLEKENDVLTALNMLTGAVIACADRHLPWAMGPRLSCIQADEDGALNYGLRYPFSEPEDEEDDPSRIYAEDGDYASEPQLFYMATGYILPRERVPSKHLTEWFLRQGVDEGRAKELTWGAMIASCMDDWRNRDMREWNWDAFDSEEKEEPAQEAETPKAPEEHTAPSVEEMLRQVKQLRQALHDTEQTAKQLQNRLLEAERQSANDRDELVQLRDTLYSIRSVDGGEEQLPDTGIELPWRTQRRILAFGGHDTWRKAIRPLLPGVQFIDREALPDISALKNADVIWIQANALSHKFYYRIVDTARKNGISVRYFGFASARKCAEQLVTDELSSKK